MYFKSKKDPFIEGFPEMNLFKYLKIFLFFYPDTLIYDASSPTKTKIVENTKSNLFWKYIEEKTNRTITRSEYHKLNNFDTDLSVPLTINGYTFDCTYPNGITSQSDLDKLLYNGVLYNGKTINGGTTSNLVTTLVSKNNDFLMNEFLPKFQIKSIDIFNDLLKNQEGILDAKYVLNKNLALLVKKLSLSPNDLRTEYVFDPNVYKDYLSSNNIFSYVAPANVNGTGTDTSLFDPADTKLIPVEKVRLQIIPFEGWRNLVNHLRSENIKFATLKSLFPLFYSSLYSSYSETLYNLNIAQVKEKMRVNLNPILKDKTPMIKEPIRDIKIPFREENWTIENQDAFDRLSVTWDDMPNYIYYADLKPYILEKYPENSIQYSQIYRNLYLRVADVNLPRYNVYDINLGMELRRSKSITNSEIVTLNVVYNCLFKWGHPKIGERKETSGYVDSYVYRKPSYSIIYSNNVLGLNLGLTKARIMDKRPLAGLFQIMRNGDKKEVTTEMWNLWEHSSFTFDLTLNLDESVPGNSTYYNYNLLIPDLKSNNFYYNEVVDGMREKHKMLGTLNDFVTQFYGTTTLTNAINSYNRDKTFFNKWNGEISKWLKEHITTAGGAGELHKFLNDLIASAGSIDGWNRINGTKQVREHVMQHYNRLHNNFINPYFIPLIEEKDMEERNRIENAMMNLFSTISKKRPFVNVTPGARHYYISDTLCTFSMQNNNLIINFNKRYIKWKADIYNKNDWNNYSHTLYVGFNNISSDKGSLDNYGFESQDEFLKALEYYIRYGRIRVAAGTYTYELFKGSPNLQTIKSFHSNGEIIPVNLVSLPYLTEFDKSSRNEYDNEKFSTVSSESTFSKYTNNPLVIKGGLYIIPTLSGRWEYRTINSIDDIPKNKYDFYDIYMVHLVNMFGEDGKNRDYDSFFTFTPDR